MKVVFFAVWFALTIEALAQNPVPNLREYRDRAANQDGDIRRGKELFFDENKCACARCHSVDGTAAKVGPDLFTAGDKFPRRELIRAILEPSESIAVGYGTTIIETKSGEEYSGVIKQVTTDWTELMLADGHSVRVNARDIKEQRGSNISLMPEGLHTAISAREFVDLVAFVASLKEPQTAVSMNRGTPAEIPELAKPVQLVPFFSEELRFPHAFVHKPGDVRSGLVWFGQLPGFTNTFVAVHQTGKIWLLEKRAEGDTKTLFADVSSDLFNERGPNGLLSIAFHPKFRQNRKYYVKHQVYEDQKIATVLAEREAGPDLKHDSGKPSRRMLKIVSSTQDHSGGCIEFGPDGFLYLAMGDTGPQQDPQGHGQDMQLFLSKIIRIDVDKRDEGLEYGIPPENPFRGRSDVRPEIWAYGFREPWRFTFDSLNGDLWVGDVGQDRIEEVAIVRRGENHGWNVYEGFEPFSNRYRREGEKYIDPIFAYRRKFGNSITGGYVYRGNKASSFYGVYICGDYTSKRIWGLTQENRVLKTVRQIAVSPQFIASFGTDETGNIYVVGYEGMVYKIDFDSSTFDAAPPAEHKTVKWTRNAFPMPESIWSVEALDANRDGRLDLIAMGETKVFALTAPDWKQSVLADTQEPKMLYCVEIDADRDGDSDLAVGRYQQPWINHREGKSAAEPKGPDFSVAWIENVGNISKQWPLHVVDRELNGIHGMWTGDVNRDGMVDLISDSIMGPAFPKSLIWFESPTFKRHIITKGQADGRPHYLDFADLNGDGWGDLLVGDSGGGTFTWWENPKSSDGTWIKHQIAKDNGATNIKGVDINDDGKLDVVASCGHGKGVFWFEAPNWTKHEIQADLSDPHALAIGDFDDDSDLDVAAASFTAFVVRWYENDGKGDFTAHDIDTGNKQQAYDLKAIDLDRDTRTDLILAGRESRNVVWYQNRGSSR